MHLHTAVSTPPNADSGRVIEVLRELEAEFRQTAHDFRAFLNGPYADRSITGSLNADSMLGQSAGWENAASVIAKRIAHIGRSGA